MAEKVNVAIVVPSIMKSSTYCFRISFPSTKINPPNKSPKIMGVVHPHQPKLLGRFCCRLGAVHWDDPAKVRIAGSPWKVAGHAGWILVISCFGFRFTRLFRLLDFGVYHSLPRIHQSYPKVGLFAIGKPQMQSGVVLFCRQL